MMFKWLRQRKINKIKDKIVYRKAELKVLAAALRGATELDSYYVDTAMRLTAEIETLEAQLARLEARK